MSAQVGHARDRAPTKGVECVGPEASAFTKHRLTGRVVRLESDVVRRGYARFLVIPPNDAHGRALLAAELDARRARRGLWGEC